MTASRSEQSRRPAPNPDSDVKRGSTVADVRVEQAARLARVWNELGAVEVAVTQENSFAADIVEADLVYTIDTRYIETLAGQRFQDLVGRDRAGRISSHTSAYTDGSRFVTVEFLKEQPEVPTTFFVGTSFGNEASRGASVRPEPLRYYHVGKIPLHEALPSATYLGAERLQGRPTHRFLFRDVIWGQMRQIEELHLAEDGLIPARLVCFKDEEDRLAAKPLWSWTVTEERVINGHPFPIRGRLVSCNANQPGVEEGSTEMTVTRVEFGKTYPPTTFWREADARARIYDAVKGKITPPKVTPTPPKAVIVANPIRAEQDPGSSSFATGSLALGVVLLLTGLGLWLRRQ